jgi:hypothetical protein
MRVNRGQSVTNGGGEVNTAQNKTRQFKPATIGKEN